METNKIKWNQICYIKLYRNRLDFANLNDFRGLEKPDYDWVLGGLCLFTDATGTGMTVEVGTPIRVSQTKYIGL